MYLYSLLEFEILFSLLVFIAKRQSNLVVHCFTAKLKKKRSTAERGARSEVCIYNLTSTGNSYCDDDADEGRFRVERRVRRSLEILLRLLRSTTKIVNDYNSLSTHANNRARTRTATSDSQQSGTLSLYHKNRKQSNLNYRPPNQDRPVE